MQPPRSAVEQAYRHLNRVAENLAAECRDTFPSVRALARQAGVSTQPILIALKRLNAEGKVRTVGRGRGARIVRAGTALAIKIPAKLTLTEEHKAYRWEIVRRQIAEDILNGIYKENQKLPSFKELHLRFGDCYETLSRALAALAESGLVRESGNRYCVAPLSRPSRTTIYLFVPGIISPARISIHDERHHDAFRLIEVECKDRSLALKIVDINNLDRPLLAREYKADALGAIVWCTESFAENDAILDFLNTFNRPVAFIDEDEYYRVFYMTHHRTHRKIRFFSMATSKAAAKNIGKMLLRLGHGNVGYISIYGDKQFMFSSHRLEGLRAAYTAAGMDEGVKAFTSDIWDAPVAWNLPEKSFVNKSAWSRLTGSAQKIIALHPDKFLGDLLLSTLDLIPAREKFRHLCLPLFEAALADPSITAWVCANDQMAFYAVDFLAARRKRVPADISLVGFDDLFRAFQNNLTSYNFNVPMLVHRIFQYFLNPSAAALFTKQEAVEIAGHIMQRQSVGKARVVRFIG
ncbi:MAG: GntR family transcriptional regulator [Chitinivibrionales bacterium]|nr:GntR family transcriptional regulator [Chitinivibrionales bacterium]